VALQSSLGAENKLKLGLISLIIGMWIKGNEQLHQIQSIQLKYVNADITHYTCILVCNIRTKWFMQHTQEHLNKLIKDGLTRGKNTEITTWFT
jgi:hypothetical protein